MRSLFFLFLFIAACSLPDRPPNTLRISFNTHPNTLDPRKAADFVSSTLINLIYEGLTRSLPGGQTEPALAEWVDISRDEKTYVFHLRKAFWTDGKPITAYDFESSWKQALHSSCAYLFYPIKNAQRYAQKQVEANTVGIKALSAQVLRVELEHPTPYFYSLTSFPSFLPAPRHTDDPSICSGPFRIETIHPQSEITLSKNPLFWNRNAISIDQIHISIVPDEITALQMFERGELDWIGGSLSPLPLDALEKLKDEITYIPSAASTLCAFNTQVFPFHNLHLRKAFSLAINREEIVQQVTQTKQLVPTTVLPPSLTSRSYSFYDPEAARSFFQKALEELNISADQLESLILYYKPGQVEKRLAQTLQRQWKEVLGVTIQLVHLDFKSHAHRLQNKDYQLSLATWIAQFDDPMSILDRFKDKSNLKNYPGWENPQYTELLDQANHSKKRIQLLQKAEDLLADQIPLTPIYHWSSPALCNIRIESGGSTPCGGILFERFRLKDLPQ